MGSTLPSAADSRLQHMSEYDAPLADSPLADLVVVDLTRALAGPQAAMMLGDLGARVIKVESATGDDTRAWGPPWAGAETGHHEDSTYFMSANRNKESL